MAEDSDAGQPGSRRKTDSGFYQIAFKYGLPILTILFTMWLTNLNAQMAKQGEDIGSLRLQVAEFKGIATQLDDIKDFVKEVRSEQMSKTGRLSTLEAEQTSLGKEVAELRATLRALEEMQKQIVLSLREIRDDLKIYVREREKK